MSEEKSLGKGINRVEGPLKVTGKARYTGDQQLPKMAYAALIESTIASGSVSKFDDAEAAKLPGVLQIISHKNAKALIAPQPKGGIGSEAHLVLQSDKVLYNGQIIGIVVAESFEQARYAAERVKVSYSADKAFLDLQDKDAPSKKPPERFGTPLQVGRGDPAKAFPNAEVTFEATYETPVEHHNPMEPHATVAQWNGLQVTVFETTQHVNGVQANIASMFGIDPRSVKIISNYVGGGFGCKGSTWQHTAATVMAAKIVDRPVKLVLTRQNMFPNIGHRPRTIQKIGLAADKKGKLLAITHDVETHSSQLQDFIEPSSLLTRMLYDTPHLGVSLKLAKLHKGTSTFMRAPGEASGSFALECALDEFAYKLGVDPIALRVVNYAEKDPDNGKIWSSKQLRQCYEMGAKSFGWDKRANKAAATKRDGKWIGMGMATATYPGNKQPAAVRMRLEKDGSLYAASATHEIGQGTYTIMTQIAADEMGLPVEKVKCELGQSTMPMSPVAGGSMTAASIGPAIQEAAKALKKKLWELTRSDHASPLAAVEFDKVMVWNGKLVASEEKSRGLSYQEILQRAKLNFLDAEGATKAEARGEVKDHCRVDQSTDPSCFSFHSFGAQFCEVEVDALTMQVRVTRFLGVYDVGKVLNQKTARSQGLGGITMGIGMALMEETSYDPHSGRIMTRNLADYHVPVHADIPAIEVQFTDVPDLNFTSIGSRGVGEIPIVGAAAAVANAVYHATGIRVRELPITPDKLLV